MIASGTVVFRKGVTGLNRIAFITPIPFSYQAYFTAHVKAIEFYAPPVRTQRWGQDLLGDAILPPASSALVSFDDRAGSCRFDLKVVFDDGSVSVRRDVNVCLVERYAISYR
jgi:hypothetical protein